MKLSELKIIESKMSDLHQEKIEALMAELKDDFKCDDDMAEKLVAYLVDNEDDDEVDDLLFSHFESEMPYGTQKARDGDPKNWIANEMERRYSKLTKGL